MAKSPFLSYFFLFSSEQLQKVETYPFKMFISLPLVITIEVRPEKVSTVWIPANLIETCTFHVFILQTQTKLFTQMFFQSISISLLWNTQCLVSKYLRSSQLFQDVCFLSYYLSFSKVSLKIELCDSWLVAHMLYPPSALFPQRNSFYKFSFFIYKNIK